MEGLLHGYIGMGSNLGERLGHLQAAVDRMAAAPGLAVLRASPVYESQPWGYASPNLYLNAVVELTWNGAPLSLQETLTGIEAAGERQMRKSTHSNSYADRAIDLDILWLDGVESDDPRLTIPHPRAHLRAFVLIPWRELAPKLLLRGESIAHWITKLPPGEVATVKRQNDLQLSC